jgi:hypothetical protein
MLKEFNFCLEVSCHQVTRSISVTKQAVIFVMALKYHTECDKYCTKVRVCMSKIYMPSKVFRMKINS